MSPDRIVLSRPYPVVWAGFRSDTFALQQVGWEFSASQSYEMDGVGLMMRNRALGIHASTNMVPMMQFHDHIRDPNSIQPFHVQWLTDKEVRFQHYVPDYLDYCNPVDMKPQFATVEERSLDSMNVFADASMARTKELIVDPHSVPELMDRILELQEPGRREHFKQIAAEARDAQRASPRQEFHAQILSLA